ncbi:MAG: hypothetical protein QOG42_602 [Solirubrobacteraceae bacterium]|jgi:hypothetical protein|nr:hypothetical protein [Solirubrobacteraceae bacterium]
MSATSETSERLRAAVRESGSPLADVMTAAPAGYVAEGGPDPVALAASGPRVTAHRDDVELAVSAVLEGCLLHYGRPRVVHIADPDLALLAGDRLYALGLARLAAIGDLTAIAELADIIALSAQAHTAGDGELALAAWHAGAASIGWGADDATAAAKQLARQGDPGAAAALHDAAVRAGL